MEASSRAFFDTRVFAICDGDSIEAFTDIQGDVNFPGESVLNIKAFLESSMVTIFDGSSNPAMQLIKNPSDPLNPIIIFDYYGYIGNPSNQYYHSVKYIDWLCESVFSAPLQYPRLDIITGCTMPEQGKYFPGDSVIKINHETGMFCSSICHEMTHALVYNQLDLNFFSPFPPNLQNEILYGGMDEAFSFYYPCAYRDDATYRYPTLTIELADRLTVISVYNNSNYTPPNTTLDESFYSYYGCREPIGSAWWEIRNRLGDNYFNHFLVNTLIDNVSPTDSLRYKPRYFYNALMRNSTPSNQLVIDKAYSDRGLYFTPQVISAGVSNPPDGRDKNMFRIGDPVHVKVTNCPQNTPLTVYIVEDQDYSDGMNISALNAIICQVSGTSDNDGVWYSSSPVMTASAVGDYDILVDIGNNGMLHFAYIRANVRDGFDGLNGPGFTIYDDGIDVVLALDISGSMGDECINLQRLTRRFISAMLPGDKINIFGFNEGTPPNWNGGYINFSPTPTAQLYSITSSNQNSFINSVGVPSAGGNTDLLVPFTYGYNRFGTPTERKKGMVLLSDGEHNPTIDPENPHNHYYSNLHTMNNVSTSIYSNYNPRGIECYTMRFGNNYIGIVNMNNIASWGHGIAYQVPYLSNMSLIVSRLINRLRGNPPSYENNHSIPPNSNQTFQIEVDDLADNLRTTLIWNTSVNLSDNLFTLTSPSGIIYNQPECLGFTTQKYIIDAPESGI
ncbi:MAG TPA: vWA domain-containing protein [Candidatus Cloacimonas sp.]|jgi:Mg-chelatase subunit ChlD|nr:vWA domain-containing protein [Candidatus Cloacimonas sp.]